MKFVSVGGVLSITKSVTGTDSLMGIIFAELLDTSAIKPASDERNTDSSPFSISFSLLISRLVKLITATLFEGEDIFTSSSLNVKDGALALFEALK